MIIKFKKGMCYHCNEKTLKSLNELSEEQMCLYIEADCHGDAEYWCEEYLKEMLQILILTKTKMG